MEPELITYQKFNDAGLAEQLAEVLTKHGIAYKIEEQSFSFNPTFYADETAKDFAVKINAGDFERVNELLQTESAEEIKEVDDEHYLFKFTNEELTELVAKRDEWSAYDYQLALKILKERGVEMNEAAIAALNQQRLDELRKIDPPQTAWIIAGYIFAVLGGVFGIAIGWNLANNKKTLPNGETVFNYSDGDRKHGKRIFYLAIIGSIVGLYLKISHAI